MATFGAMAQGSVHAQVQTNGSTATGVATASGGRQIITPAAPKNDVSYNAFSRFDVNAAGATFANQDVRARTIVAEVFSPLPSRIEGPVNVDGPRANLILAKALMDFSKLSSQQKGVVGELIGAETVQNVLPGATRLGRMGEVGSQGIDDLYKVASPTADYVIVEYKFGQSALGKTADGLQMSDSWVAGSDRILNAVGKNPVEAEAISNAMKAGRVEKWVVHTDPAGGTSIWIVDSAGKIAKADSSVVSKVLGPNK